MQSKRWLLGLGVVGALLLALCGRAQAEAKQLRVAVMDFTAASTTGEFEALGVGLQSMITTDLAELPAFSLIERARLKDLQAELKLAQSDAIDKTTAAKLGGLAGATHLLVGSFTVVAGKMRLDARLFVVATGEVILTEKSEGMQIAFFDLEKQLVKKIVDTVGVKLAKAQKAELAKPETQSLDAFAKFSQGIVFADQKNGPQAIASMQAAVAADGSFALAATKLREFQALFPVAPPAPPKVESQCKPNPLFAGQCGAGGGGLAVPTPPTLLTGAEGRHHGVIVRAQGQEGRCTTPCQVHLPEGQAEVEVVGVYKQQVTVPPGGGRTVRVNARNKTNLIIGATLAGLFGAMLVTTIVLYAYDRPYDPTGNTSAVSFREYGPIPLALAAGLAYPAVHFLLRIGKNEVTIGE